MACLKKARAPAMTVAAAALALLLMALAQGGPLMALAQGGKACSSIPLFKECLSKEGLTLPTDSNSPAVLSAECCNAFAAGQRECLCLLRDQLRDRVTDPKKLLCPANTGCPDP